MNATLIPHGGVVADIGCDHAKLAIYLIEKKKAAGVIAMDIGRGPLARAADNIARCHMEQYIECRLSDGAKALNILPDGSCEADHIVMAGIGGRLALKIVEDSRCVFDTVDDFVVQAQSELHIVRKSLTDMGYIIIDEDMVFDEGKYYSAMKLTHVSHMPGTDRQELDEAQCMYGPCLIEKRHPVLHEYLKFEKDKYDSLINDIPEDKRTEISERLKMTGQLLMQFDGVA